MRAIQCGLLPGESQPVVRRLNEPLRRHLERVLRRPVELVVGSSYVATGEMLRRGEIDFAYLGPVTYILQSRTTPLEAFARPTHGGSTGPTFRAVIITASDSPYRQLGDLAGLEFAGSDTASTSGSWVPRKMMLDAGLVQSRDYRKVSLGTHDAVIRAVVAGQVPAGGVSAAILQRLLVEQAVDPDALRILAESPPIPEYMWTFRADIDPGLREAVREAFLVLDDPAALDVFRARAFIPAVDADVDRVRNWMEQILEARLPSRVAAPTISPVAAHAVARSGLAVPIASLQ